MISTTIASPWRIRSADEREREAWRRLLVPYSGFGDWWSVGDEGDHLVGSAYGICIQIVTRSRSGFLARHGTA